MKNEIIHVKTIREKLWKKYFQVITNACVKVAVLEICFEKKTKEFVCGTLKNICTVAAHCWYIKNAFAGYCQLIFEKNCFRIHFSGWMLSLELKVYLEKFIPSSEM